MRVLLCNKFYYRRGGDCTYTLNLESLLRASGHDVAVFAMETPEALETSWRSYFPAEVDFASARGKLRLLARSLGLGDVRTRFVRLLEDFRPDVVHLNNIHTQLSPVLAELAHRRGIRVVWTLHDYKLLCPRYDCLRRGETVCESCFAGKWPVLRHACMKNSLAASAMAWLEAVTWHRRRLVACTDRFICPSAFMAEKMAQGGFPAEKLTTCCNFTDTAACVREDYAVRGDYYCYVGRLSHEKGMETLVGVASRLPHPLVVVGDGPLRETLPEAPNITYTGRKDWADIKRIVGEARFLVIPSEWYENNPLSVIEALCLGTPVLGAAIGGIPELIESGVSGMTFSAGDAESLSAGIAAMYAADFSYADIARAAQARFSPASYCAHLMNLYQNA
ncbi:MAG: glycosyltransferase [Bacteroidales bacterium]|nr:glycosyltransferase [Bacteroidales bacterium]